MNIYTFHELQPPRLPRWMPLCLETEVTADSLRYRLRRGGSWHTVALSDIEAAEVIPFQQKSWPLSVNTGPFGSRVTSTSGRGVALSLRGGKKLLLGSAEPEQLLAALLPSERH